MIIDNKQSYGSNPDVKTVWDCILSYTDPSARVGRMDVVTRMTYSNKTGFVEKENCTIIHDCCIGNVFTHLIAPKVYFQMLPYSQKLYLCK